jgi:hypothetical protein
MVMKQGNSGVQADQKISDIANGLVYFLDPQTIGCPLLLFDLGQCFVRRKNRVS